MSAPAPDSGQTLALAVVFMAALLLMAAAVLDVGRLLVARSELERTGDAVVTAVARQPTNQGDPCTAAAHYLTANPVAGVVPHLDFCTWNGGPTSAQVEVVVSVTIPLSGLIPGHPTALLRCKAAATWVSPAAVSRITGLSGLAFDFTVGGPYASTPTCPS